MLNKSYRLKLARMLKLYQEVSTDRGLLIAENDDVLTAGVEVFVENENGEIVPAADGVYVDTANRVQYVVEAGTIKEILEYKNPEEQTIEDGTNPDEQSNDTGDTTQVETPTENPEDETKSEEQTEENTGSDNGNEETQTDEKDEQIANLTTENEELKRQIAELEKLLAEYKEKENFTEPSAEEKEKFETQKEKTEFDKKLEAAKRLNKVLRK